MIRKSSLMSKFMVLMLAFAVVFTYSVLPLNQTYAASSKKPAKVTGVKASAISASAIKVSWSKAKNAKKYEVYKSTKKSSGFKKAATTSKKAYTIKKLTGGKKYYFKVRAVNGKKKGKFSKVVYATTKKDKTKEVKEVPATLGELNKKDITTVIDMSNAEYNGKTVKVWVPVPQSDEYQTVTEPEFKAEGAVKAEINTETANGNRMLYLEWGKDSAAESRKATMTYTVSRYDVSRSDLKEQSEYDFSDEAKAYINKESEYVIVNDPVVKKYAAEATAGKTGTLEKTRAIYEWIINNLARIDNGEKIGDYTFEVVGCGYGDTVKILSDFEKYGIAGGHCTDLNSTFVALCRASGIPAREMFGIRMTEGTKDDGYGMISDYQHCWAEFYLPGTGWVPADPADVLKAIKPAKAADNQISIEAWNEAKKSSKCEENTKKYWGHVDNNRYVLSRGRDITFVPAQSWGKCNNFGYPQAEVDGKQLMSFAKYKEFAYSITSTKNNDPVFITADELLENDGSLKLIDLRKAADFKTAHIPGAVSADVSGAVSGENAAAAKANVEAAIAGDPADQKYVLLCYTGNKYANAGREILLGLGKENTNLFILGQDDKTQGPNGGMAGWNAKGYETVPVVDAVKTTDVYVTPQWLRSAQAGEQAGYENLVVIEVSYGGSSKTYPEGHVPGAIQAASTEVEDGSGEPGEYKAYNLLSVDDIRANLASHGITADTKVVLYDAGGDPCEVGRQAYGYLVAGLKDVKVLDGHLAAWKAAGYKTETGENAGPAAAVQFGDAEAHLEYWTSINDAKDKLDKTSAKYDAHFKLVSIRSEAEFLGQTSGYNYINKAGEPEGAVWGKGAKSAYDVADFVNEDGTVKELDGLKAVWEGCNFATDDTDHLSFYCGTGWRATVPFLVLYENGYKNISVYDGGWYEWIMNEDYPVQVGDPASPDCQHVTVKDLPADKAAQ
jgi:thiosulfate/3-mercaptopyruvate sulfurtransferase